MKDLLLSALSFGFILAMYVITLLLDRLDILPIHQGLAWLVCLPSAILLFIHTFISDKQDAK